jgi:hypothetical protein
MFPLEKEIQGVATGPTISIAPFLPENPLEGGKSSQVENILSTKIASTIANKTYLSCSRCITQCLPDKTSQEK